MLIDRRNRLEGELKKLAAVKLEAVELHKHVQRELKAATAALDELGGMYDPARIRIHHSLKTSARGNLGMLTRLIITALKQAGDRALSTPEVVSWVKAHWTGNPAATADAQAWRKNVGRRMRNLRLKGVLVSPAVGNGYSSRSTWKINPDLVLTGLDTESTLFDDGDLGSSHRTTVRGHTDECD